MSDSIKKYYELLEEGALTQPNSPNHTSTMTILNTLSQLHDVDSLQLFIEKATHISKSGKNLTPATVFQIAHNELTVCQLCTPKK
jgi:hypothetical protein